MDLEKICEEIEESLNKWLEGKDKIVVAIDGYTGIGKTTILKKLAEINPEIVPVNRDDFLLPREVVREKVAKAEDRSKVFELEVNDNKKLENFINRFRSSNDTHQIYTYNDISGKVDVPKTYAFSKKVMVVEGVFMFHPKLPLNELWDKRIYLHGDIAKIDERRIKREKERWGDKYHPETDPDSYFKAVTTGLKRYIDLYKPEEMADLVIKMD